MRKKGLNVHFSLEIFASRKKKQGQLHGYPCRVQMGRGSEKNAYHALMQKPPANAQKVKPDQPTNQPTDRQTELVIEVLSKNLGVALL